jgi:imidazolonepropionase-like amidohydrolase
VILRNARLIDGTGKVWDCADIVISVGRIESITPRAAPSPVQADEIDLTGRTVIPGLVNCHVHVCLDPGADPWALWDGRSLAENVLVAAKQVEAMLRAGITTARDLGGIAGVDIGLKRAVARGLLSGPRLLVSGNFLTMTGGHGHTHGGLEVDGPDEARKGARQQIKAGADVIKVMATGGVMTEGVEPGAAQLSHDELGAAVEEAHKAGRKAATHAQGTAGIINALRAGVDSIEHGFYLNEEAIALMLERSVTFVPTLSALYRIIEHGQAEGVQPFVVEKACRAVDAQWASVQRAHRAGVSIAAGNDGGSPFNPQSDLAMELELLVQVGLSPAEALATATCQAASLLGLSDEVGTVQPGKRADIVVLSGDPLAEIGAVRQVQMVVWGGSSV